MGAGEQAKSLPMELVFTIVSFLPQEHLAPLLRSNRAIYHACKSLLYRDMYIRMPMHLARLTCKKDLAKLLKNTLTMSIDDYALYPYVWEGKYGVESLSDDISRRPIQCLITLLKATVSLRWLQIYQSGQLSHGCLTDTAYDELAREAADPTFLPELTFGIVATSATDYNHLACLFKHRKVKYHSLLEGKTLKIRVRNGPESDICSFVNWKVPGSGMSNFIENSLQTSRGSTTSLDTLEMIVENQVNLSGLDELGGWLKELIESMGSSGLKLSHLVIHLAGTVTLRELFNAIKHPAYIEEFVQNASYLQGIVFVLGSMQLRPSIWWRKAAGCIGPRPNWVPILTPQCPITQEILSWWLEALFPSSSIAQMCDNEEINCLAAKLYRAFPLDSHAPTTFPKFMGRREVIKELRVFYAKSSRLSQ
ncbi:hypothetical protein FRC11_012434 [Ceratobasidium sp. 423]|nr:hypothetical protein FRC11_012434 [Ceratobasidium sp. 423]